MLPTVVLCCYMLSLTRAAAPLRGRQNTPEDSIGPFPQRLRTFGLPQSDEPLLTTFTVAYVQSHTTVYEVQTTTLHPFNRVTTPTAKSEGSATSSGSPDHSGNINRNTRPCESRGPRYGLEKEEGCG
ncbi:hypothetical protein L218DRAFT_959442 [Marasmius fiardii PR-910]|nr:hypothetical protein L218DRAFT_959442 [Marasmius fiardii PR-910]